MKPDQADRIAEHTSQRAAMRADMVAKGASENTLYGFDLRSQRLLRELVQSLAAK